MREEKRISLIPNLIHTTSIQNETYNEDDAENKAFIREERPEIFYTARKLNYRF